MSEQNGPNSGRHVRERGRYAPRPGWVRRAARWWFDGWVSVPQRALFGPEAHAIATDARELARHMRADYERWQRARRSRRSPLSYDQMLAAWGIEGEDVPHALRVLGRAQWRIAAIAAFAYGALLVELVRDRFNSWLYLCVAASCVVALGVSSLVLSWRLHCLRMKGYQEFGTWLGACLPSFRR
jgi:hypothetical protein